jgi:hypothetical protein
LGLILKGSKVCAQAAPYPKQRYARPNHPARRGGKP